MCKLAFSVILVKNKTDIVNSPCDFTFLAFGFCSIEEFIPLLKERMNVLNPYVRQFLVGWITVLDSVPDIDMLGFLPDFLDGNCSFDNFS